MKWCTFQADGRTRLGALLPDDRVVDVTLASRMLAQRQGQGGMGGMLPSDLGSLLFLGSHGLEAARESVRFVQSLKPSEGQKHIQGVTFAPDQITYLPPIGRPGKIICAGVNYRSHFLEKPDAQRPKEPFFFAKMASTMVGHGATVPFPAGVTKLDYEVELAVILGRRASRVSPDQALDHVFGFTLLNDLSSRDLQFERNQLTLGKNFDGSCPVGPWVVLREDFPRSLDVRLTSRVNGELRQDCRTSDMIFDVPTLLSKISATLTLEPGDIISTGTPAGVGMYQQPPAFLKSGDIVELELEHVGKLATRIG